MQDYGEMVRALMMQAQPVGDVVPFIKKGLGPNPMNLTEGAGRVQGGGASRGGLEGQLQRQFDSLKPQTDRDKYEAAMLRQAIERALMNLPPLD